MPEWFECGRFLAGVKGPVALRLNAAVERAFIKSGTGITTRLLVLDKVESSDEPVAIRTNDFRQLTDLVDAFPPRASLEAVPEQSRLPLRAPFRLVAAPRRPLPTPARITPSASAIASLTYVSLETPAPLAPQVGHYLPYRPSRIVIDGAAGHPTPLVESVAMGSISAPKPDAVPQLPDGLVAKGLLSAAQAETLIYAASAHGRDLPGRFEPEDKGCSLKASAEGQTYRLGYFLGDGTGAGKGRQVASVILDRWVRGERRHIWISKNEALLEDARRDWAALGGLPIDIQPLASWKLGTPIAMRDGILFVTYPTLRSGRSDATRLDQIIAWAGEDFDGVIVFDEAHAMANAAGGEGSRGKVKGSEQGIAGVRLQNLLPRARVLYASATGASDVNNLAYATRLGLWGPETAFANREAFVADIRDGGIAAMELAMKVTLEYTKERKAFGKPIFSFQNTRFKLAECATLAHVVRSFVNDCIQRQLDGTLDNEAAYMAKWWCTELQTKMVDRGVQLHGGYGYLRDYPIERFWRDLRVHSILEGTNQIMRMIVGRDLLRQ